MLYCQGIQSASRIVDSSVFLMRYLSSQQSLLNSVPRSSNELFNFAGVCFKDGGAL
jgi:hypothetical protein